MGLCVSRCLHGFTIALQSSALKDQAGYAIMNSHACHDEVSDCLEHVYYFPGLGLKDPWSSRHTKDRIGEWQVTDSCVGP